MAKDETNDERSKRQARPRGLFKSLLVGYLFYRGFKWFWNLTRTNLS